MRNLLLFLFLVGAPVVVFGRIGETVEQCRDRYGAEKLVTDSGKHHFEMSGFRVVCSFDSKGMCSSIIFMKGDGQEFTATERDVLLEKNAAGGKWVVNKDFDKRFDHSAGEWMAMELGSSLVISVVAKDEGDPEKAKKKLEGF